MEGFYLFKNEMLEKLCKCDQGARNVGSKTYLQKGL